MPRGALPFRQADVARAIKGATAGGMKVGRMEIDPTGRIVLVSSDAAPPEPATELDAWKAKRDARKTEGH